VAGENQLLKEDIDKARRRLNSSASLAVIRTGMTTPTYRRQGPEVPEERPDSLLELRKVYEAVAQENKGLKVTLSQTTLSNNQQLSFYRNSMENLREENDRLKVSHEQLRRQLSQAQSVEVLPNGRSHCPRCSQLEQELRRHSEEIFDLRASKERAPSQPRLRTNDSEVAFLEVEGKLRQAEERLRQAEGRIMASTSEGEELQTAMTELRRRVGQAEVQLSLAKQDGESLGDQVVSLRKECQQLRVAKHEAEEAEQNASLALQRANRECDRLHGEKNDAQQQLKVCAQRVAVIQQQLTGRAQSDTTE
jgi:chromosome segregation ATPase